MLERGLKIRADGDDAAEIFLCHNNQDADVVRHIADALELEGGSPFFLDAYAIPTGVEFMPAIEDAMASAKGCAIFLGRNGWGSTHFWEANLALTRYRRDPDFRLVPVVLPGVTDADMQRLGDGSVFGDINRSNLTEEPLDQVEVKRLAAALAGKAAPQYRTPAELTPYQLRRDAARWRDSEKEGRRDARDILYQGAELREAQDILLANPDFAVVSEVQPFIAAAQIRERSKLLRVTSGAIVVSIVLCLLAGFAFYSATVAENRRLQSLSRALAIQAPQDDAPGRQLLIALEASRASDTTEARGAVLRALEDWHWLVTEHQLFGGVTATTTAPDGSSALAGTDDGSIYRIQLKGKPDRIGEVSATITALAEAQDAVLVGTLDGTVETLDTFGDSSVLLNGLGRQFYITAIRSSHDGSLIAAGDQRGNVHILRPGHPPVTHDAGEESRIDALAISPDMRRIVAMTGGNRLVVYQGPDWQEAHRWPLTQNALDVAFLGVDQLAFVTSGGLMRRVKLDQHGVTIEASFPFQGLFSSARIDPQAGILALGEANGFITLADLFGNQIGFRRIRAHPGAIAGLGVLEDSNVLVSVASDGGAATWSMEGAESFGKALPRLGAEPVSLIATGSGDVLAATRDTLSANLWQLSQSEWIRIADLVALTSRSLGKEASGVAGFGQPASTSVDLSTTLIDKIALSDVGAAWSTWDGAVMWVAYKDLATPVSLKSPSGNALIALAVDSAGQRVAATEAGGGEVLLFDTEMADPLPSVFASAPVETLAFGPSNDRIAIGTSQGKVTISPLDGTSERILPDQHASPVAGTLWLGEDRLVSYASGGDNDRGLVFHVAGDTQATIRVATQRPGGAVTAADFSSKLDLIAVTDHDGMVHLWQAGDPRFVQSLFFAGSYVSAVTLDAKGERVIAAEGGGDVRSWPLSAEEWEKTICAKVGRSLDPFEWRELMPDQEYSPACASGGMD